MKAVFPIKPLIAACSALSTIVPSRTTKEILKNLKLTVSKDISSLAATDSETSAIRYLRGVECQKPGIVLLPCDRIMKILRESSGDSVSIDFSEGVAHIAIGRAKFKIPTENADDFPPVEEFTESAFRTIKSSDMAKIIRRCSCTDESSRQYALAGVNLDLFEGSLAAVATDAKCLSVVKCDFATEGDVQKPESQVVVHSKTLRILSASLGDGETVDFHVSGSAVKFRIGDTAISGQLLQGRFPKWEMVVPSNLPIQIPVVSAAISSVLRQAMITTTAESCGVNITITSGNMNVSSGAAGESTIDLPIPYEGDQQDIFINPQYILAAASLVEKESTITLNMEDGESPLLITSDDGLMWVAMPLSKDK